MTPHHWQDLDRLFHCALERPPEERPAFLRKLVGLTKPYAGKLKLSLQPMNRVAHFSTLQLLQSQVRSSRLIKQTP